MPRVNVLVNQMSNALGLLTHRVRQEGQRHNEKVLQENYADIHPLLSDLAKLKDNQFRTHCRKQLDKALAQLKTMDAVVEVFVTVPGPTNGVQLATQIITTVWSEEEKAAAQAMALEYLGNPHLIPRKGGEYNPSSLVALLGILPEEVFHSLNMCPDLRFDMVRLLLCLCALPSNDSLYIRQVYLDCNSHYARLLQKLATDLPPDQLRSLKTLVHAHPGCLGAFIYALPAEQRDELLPQMMKHLTDHYSEEAADSLLFLAQFPSCEGHLRDIFNGFVSCGHYPISAASALTAAINRDLGKELWQLYVDNLVQKGDLLDMTESEHECIEPWQWTAILKSCSPETAHGLLREVHQSDQKEEVSQSLLVGILLLPESDAQPLLTHWIHLANGEHQQWCAFAGALLLYGYNAENRQRALHYWTNALKQASLKNPTIAVIILTELQRREEEYCKPLLTSMYASSLSFLPEMMASVLTSQIASRSLTQECIAGLLIAHVNVGLRYLNGFVYSKNEEHLRIAWAILSTCYEADPDTYNNIVDSLLVNGHPNAELYLMGMQVTQNYRQMAPFFIKIPDNLLLQLSINLWSTGKLLRIQTQNLGSRLRISLIGSMLLTFVQCLSTRQTKRFLSTFNRDSPCQSMLLHQYLQGILQPSPSDIYKLVLILQSMQPEHTNKTDVLLALEYFSEYKTDVALSVARRFAIEDNLSWETPPEALTLGLLADSDTRQQLLSPEGLRQAPFATIREVIPRLLPFLLPEEVVTVAERFGIGQLAFLITRLTIDQRAALHDFYLKLPDSKRTSQLDRLLLGIGQGESSQSGNLVVRGSSRCVMVDAVPPSLHDSPAAKAENMRGDQGKVHIRVLRHQLQDAGLNTMDIESLDADWVTLHTILFHPVADTFSLYPKLRPKDYELKLQRTLQQHLESEGLNTKEPLLAFLRQSIAELE